MRASVAGCQVRQCKRSAAGVAARADERKKLERLCRYVSRPAIAEKRLSLTPNGNVRFQRISIHARLCLSSAATGREQP